MKYIYPAIFEKNEEGMIDVTFPDIFGGVTCDENEENAMTMAEAYISFVATVHARFFFDESTYFFSSPIHADIIVYTFSLHADTTKLIM